MKLPLLHTLQARWLVFKHRLPTRHALYQHGEHACHMLYLAAVSWEAHGLYGHMALVLLLISVVGILLHEH